MTFQDGIDRVRSILIDEGVTPVFSTSFLMELLNDATVAILNLHPTAYTVVESMALDEGVQQTLPDGALLLHDIPSNTDGRSITRVDHKELNAFTPSWRSEKKAKTIYHYMYDEYNRNVFWVYPPSDGTSNVELQITKVPERVVEENDPLPLSADFFDAYVYFTVARVLDGDSDEANTDARADKFFQRFAEVLGVKLQNRLNWSPNYRGQPNANT